MNHAEKKSSWFDVGVFGWCITVSGRRPTEGYLRQLTGGGATRLRSAQLRFSVSFFELVSDCLPIQKLVSGKRARKDL